MDEEFLWNHSDVTHTEIHSVRIMGRSYGPTSWADLYRLFLEQAYEGLLLKYSNRDTVVAELKKIDNGISDSDRRSENFNYLPKAAFSFRYKDAKATLQKIIKIGRLIEKENVQFKFVLDLYWKPAASSKYRGQKKSLRLFTLDDL